jgi:predicted enzyme related to lactoylglutathione lyase
MAIIDKAIPGNFCWMELATTNAPAAREFYGSIFGWTANIQDMGPSGEYTIFQLDGKDSSASYTLQAEQTNQGVPPHWMLYIAVANADEAAAKATALGATVIMGPFNVMEHGRMVVIKDPQGVMFTVWQPIKNEGIQVKDVPGAFCWADLSTPDQAASAKFYSDFFGWELDASDTGYLHIKNAGQMIGGMQAAEHRNPNAPPHWLIYYLVADVDATAAKAAGQGATLYLPPTTMENVGRMSVIADPQGAVFAIFKPAERG